MTFATETLDLIKDTFGSTEAFLEKFTQYSIETKRKDDIMETTIEGRAFIFKMFGGFNNVAVKVKDPKGEWVTVFEFNDH